MDNVIIMRLRSGEDVIARVLRQTEDSIIIQQPMQILVEQDEKSKQVNVGLATYMPFVAKHSEIVIRLDSLISTGEPTIDLRSLYSRATSGLHLAPGSVVGAQTLVG